MNGRERGRYKKSNKSQTRGTPSKFDVWMSEQRLHSSRLRRYGLRIVKVLFSFFFFHYFIECLLKVRVGTCLHTFCHVCFFFWSFTFTWRCFVKLRDRACGLLYVTWRAVSKVMTSEYKGIVGSKAMICNECAGVLFQISVVCYGCVQNFWVINNIKLIL